MNVKAYRIVNTCINIALLIMLIACIATSIYLIYTRNERFFSAIDSGVEKYKNVKNKITEKGHQILSKRPFCRQ